jgi:hypothetical protein
VVVAFEDASRGVKPFIGTVDVVAVAGKHPQMPQGDAFAVEVAGFGGDAHAGLPPLCCLVVGPAA